jgi:hypothetical protein
MSLQIARSLCGMPSPDRASGFPFGSSSTWPRKREPLKAELNRQRSKEQTGQQEKIMSDNVIRVPATITEGAILNGLRCVERETTFLPQNRVLRGLDAANLIFCCLWIKAHASFPLLLHQFAKIRLISGGPGRKQTESASLNQIGQSSVAAALGPRNSHPSFKTCPGSPCPILDQILDSSTHGEKTFSRASSAKLVLG